MEGKLENQPITTQDIIDSVFKVSNDFNFQRIIQPNVCYFETIHKHQIKIVLMAYASIVNQIK